MDFYAQNQYLSKFKGGEVTLNFDDENKIAYMCLKRPEKKNAMTGFMMVELRKRIDQLERWEEGKALIFHGEGNFCSGGDLNFAKETGNHTGASLMNDWMTTTLMKLNTLKLITVCVASGPTLGGGGEMSTFCDYLLVTEDVKFGFVHAKMGIVPAWGGATSLVKKIGYKAAMEMMLTARILTAEDCLQIGLADAQISSLNYLEEAKDWLLPKLTADVKIIKALKEICLNADDLNSINSINKEGEIFRPFWGSELNKSCLEKKIKHVE